MLVNYLPRLRYYHRYLDQQRLIFHSSLGGVGLLFISFVLLGALSFMHPRFFADAALEAMFFYACLTSFALSTIVTVGGNLLASNARKEKLLYRAIQSVGNPLDVFLSESYYAKDLLLITLDNGKVYVGWLLTSPEPQQTEYIRILPHSSGYRDAQHHLALTVAYTDLLQSDLPDSVTPEVLIELTDIMTFAKFDPRAYEVYFDKEE